MDTVWFRIYLQLPAIGTAIVLAVVILGILWPWPWTTPRRT